MINLMHQKCIHNQLDSHEKTKKKTDKQKQNGVVEVI